jgi:2-keto-3-deoxy-6-phosphogluconate aldolase
LQSVCITGALENVTVMQTGGLTLCNVAHYCNA